jgi:hypothetical protein
VSPGICWYVQCVYKRKGGRREVSILSHVTPPRCSFPLLHLALCKYHCYTSTFAEDSTTSDLDVTLLNDFRD